MHLLKRHAGRFGKQEDGEEEDKDGDGPEEGKEASRTPSIDDRVNRSRAAVLEQEVTLHCKLLRKSRVWSARIGLNTKSTRTHHATEGAHRHIERF